VSTKDSFDVDIKTTTMLNLLLCIKNEWNQP